MNKCVSGKGGFPQTFCYLFQCRHLRGVHCEEFLIRFDTVRIFGFFFLEHSFQLYYGFTKQKPTFPRYFHKKKRKMLRTLAEVLRTIELAFPVNAYSKTLHYVRCCMPIPYQLLAVGIVDSLSGAETQSFCKQAPFNSIYQEYKYGHLRMLASYCNYGKLPDTQLWKH